ncbi:MAG: Rpn family recombination-promoting nuclease/putative transposase, partial [Planctomycetaceae bacterium]|nr:Rpn family recombination-promoting nuclease/putative transposase [Planctomycetaceae bacterium]
MTEGIIASIVCMSYMVAEQFDEFKKKFQHDAFFKYKLTTVERAKEFLRFVLKTEIVEMLDLERLMIVPNSFVDDVFARSYADILYKIPLKNSDKNIMIFVLIELKTDSY